MSFKKGFSLIELMIVVTIMAILAGAAIPYVQDYVEDARRGRCKNDLEEIRNALALFELTRRETYGQTTIASLVGPFLSKSLVDPWGSPYRILSASSTAYSFGADQTDATGDEIQVFYRPRMAASRCQWNDLNLDGLVQSVAAPNPNGTFDYLQIFVTRPGQGPVNTVIATLDFGLSMTGGGAVAPLPGAGGSYPSNDQRIASFAVPIQFVPGSDTLIIAQDNGLCDKSETAASQSLSAVMKIFAP